MNLWQCKHAGCKSTAVGTGGAIGLRAIGWWFLPGQDILCPNHRPDPIDGDGRYLDCTRKNCSQCKATEEAESWQAKIYRKFGLNRSYHKAKPK